MRHDDFTDPRTADALIEAVVRQVQATPGVVAVSPVFTPPYGSRAGGVSTRLATPTQTPEQKKENPMLDIEQVSPNYFAAMRVPILVGRAISETDRQGAPPVIVVNQSVASHYWGSGNPIGKRLEGGDHSFTVIGVVPDTRYRELMSVVPTVYIPSHQSFFPIVGTTLLIRSAGDPAALVPEIRRVVRDVDARVTVAAASPFEALLDLPRAQPRLNAVLLWVFAGATLGLACLGLFAVVATMVRQRTREIGIRIAIGATATDVLRMVLGRGIALAAAGAAAGVLAGLASSRYLSALLFEVSATDPWTLVLVTAAMLGTALLAAYVPARASTRIDPMLTLRSE